MTKEEFYEVFMDKLFSDKNREQTFDGNIDTSIISNEHGIYVIKYDGILTENDILDEPERPKYYYDSKTQKSKTIKSNKLNKNTLWTKYSAQKGNMYLYIGKADSIQNRIKLYKKFCNEEGSMTNPAKTPHRGGKAICFIKDRNKLKINYLTTAEITKKTDNEIQLFYEKAKEIQKLTPELFQVRKEHKIAQAKNQVECVLETGLTELNKSVYGFLPFANSEDDKSLLEHRQLWEQKFKEL